MKRPLNINKTATVTEVYVDKNFYTIKLLINDGDYDLYFNFDKPVDVGGEDYYRLGSGESMENWEVQFSRLYYKTTTGSTSFRLYGSSIFNS